MFYININQYLILINLILINIKRDKKKNLIKKEWFLYLL